MTHEQMRRVKVGDVLRYQHPDGRPSFRVRVDYSSPTTRAGTVASGPDKGKRWGVQWDSVGCAVSISRLTKLKRGK